MRKAPKYPLETQIMLIYALTTVSNFLINAKDGVVNYNSSNEEDSDAKDSKDSKDDKLAPT